MQPLAHGTERKERPTEQVPFRRRPRLEPRLDADDIDPFADLTFNPIRQAIQDRCRKLKGRFNVFCADGFVPADEYEELLQRSKLIVCTESFGCETFRHYNVTANGAVALIVDGRDGAGIDFEGDGAADAGLESDALEAG